MACIWRRPDQDQTLALVEEQDNMPFVLFKSASIFGTPIGVSGSGDPDHYHTKRKNHRF